MSDNDQTNPDTAAAAFFHALETVDNLLVEAFVLLKDIVLPTDHDDAIRALLARASGHIKTLRKLDHPSDFQSVVASNRALLELAIDITLLHYERGVDRMNAWTDSARLKAAKDAIDFYETAKMPIPKELTPQREFVRNRTADVNEARGRYWSRRDKKLKHPSRWTGRNLKSDAYRADTHADTRFAKYYADEFARLCWNTHGSGLAGVAGLSRESIAALCGLANKGSADFAVICTTVALRDSGFIEHLDLRERLATVDAERTFIALNVLKHGVTKKGD